MVNDSQLPRSSSSFSNHSGSRKNWILNNRRQQVTATFERDHAASRTIHPIAHRSCSTQASKVSELRLGFTASSATNKLNQVPVERALGSHQMASGPKNDTILFHVTLCTQHPITHGMHPWVYHDSIKPPNVKTRNVQNSTRTSKLYTHPRQEGFHLVFNIKASVQHQHRVQQTGTFDSLSLQRRPPQLPNPAFHLHSSDHVSPSAWSNLTQAAEREKLASV